MMEQVRLGSQGTSHVDARKAVKRAERDPWNRLLSIIKDAEWVAHFCQNELPTRLPVLPNLRCGAWYVPDFNRRAPSSPSLALGCYFKSTDGHTHAWGFSLKRYNLHVLEVVQERGGCIIVDSTRRGKSMPDALSKTVPIWCAVINKAVHKRHGWETDTATGGHLALPSRQREEAEDVLTNSDYSSLCTPEHIVSPSEHTQIAALIDGWASLLLASDLRIPKLDKPLHPIFVTKDRREAALAELEKQSLNHKSFPFYPLVLISASPAAATPSLEPRTEQIGKSCVPSPLRLPDHVEHALRRAAFVYVQGSGDDEEAWASHLTPQLFWNEDSLRTFVKTGGEPAAVQMFIDATLLQSKTAARTNCQRTEPSEDCSGINITAPKGSNYELHDGDVCIGTFPISLGRRAKRHTFGFSDLARYALIIHADGRCDPGDPEDQSDRLAKLGLESGKRGLSNFRASVPYVIRLARKVLPEPILICSQEDGIGNDLNGGLAVAVLAACYTRDQTLRPPQERFSRAAPLADSSAFLEEARAQGPSTETSSQPVTLAEASEWLCDLTKDDVKRRLQWITSLVPSIKAPSRAHMLRINEALLGAEHRGHARARDAPSPAT